MKPAGRILGVDYGRRRIGLAISDPDRKIASPLETVERGGDKPDRRRFQEIISREEIALILIGLPVHATGREGKSAREARAFGRWLAEHTGCPILYWDERFTTVDAEAALWGAGLSHRRRRRRRDMVAAQMLLQSYLDAGCPPSPAAGPLTDAVD